jgi:hypothetical protein
MLFFSSSSAARHDFQYFVGLLMRHVSLLSIINQNHVFKHSAQLGTQLDAKLLSQLT